MVLDATGSMSGWIEKCKAEIEAIATGLLPQIQEVCVRRHPYGSALWAGRLQGCLHAHSSWML